MADKVDNAFKLEYRKLQKTYSQLKDHWISSVWAHAQSVKGEFKTYEAQIKHFLGVK